MKNIFEPLEKPRNRVAVGIALLSVIIAGLASRYPNVSLPSFVVSHAGDALWTVAVYLTLAELFPRWSPARLGLAAFGISFAVEFSQLLDSEWLRAVRATRPGRLLLGSGFLRVDLVRYLCGAIVATTVDWILSERAK